MKNKLIQTDKGFIVIDECTHNIENGDCYLLGTLILKWHETLQTTKPYDKVIYSTYYINNSIPILTNTVDEIEQMFKNKEVEELINIKAYDKCDIPRGFMRLPPFYKHAFIKGYNSNKAEYTREQVLEAMQQAVLYENKTYEQILQSIKPKHEPVYCEVVDYSFEVDMGIGDECVEYNKCFKITKIL